MIELEVPYRRTKRTALILNEWDVQKDDLVHDIPQYSIYKPGKRNLFKFNDGSNWFAEINFSTDDITKGDYVYFIKKAYLVVSFIYCIMEIHHIRQDGNFSILPPKPAELLHVKNFLSGDLKQTLTRREKVLVLEDLKRRLVEKGIGEDFVVDNIVNEATNPKNKGFERLKANAMIGRILGVELEETVVASEQPRALIGNLNMFTVQDQRRNELPNTTELREIVGFTATVTPSPPEGVELDLKKEPNE